LIKISLKREIAMADDRSTREFRVTRSVAPFLLGAALAACTIASVAASPPLAPGGALKLLARYPVSASPSPAQDVRWAGDGSVYLLRAYDGLGEVALASSASPGLAVGRYLVPPIGTIHGGFHRFTTFAVSQGNLAVADHHQFASSAIEPEGGSRVFARQVVQIGDDVDLLGRKVVFLGYPRDAAEAVGDAKRGILWLGTLDEPFKDFHPVLLDAQGPGPRALSACLLEELASVRFLGDGSFVAVPGVEPGVHLFSPEGKLVRSWDSGQLGLDSARCGELSDKEWRALRLHPEQRLARVNRMRVVDDILPLPQGPGLLVRTSAEGEVSWVLEILEPDRVVTYAIPFTSRIPADRLRGDVRGGRMVLLRSAHLDLLSGGNTSPGELIVAEVPRG
jgi:hypothetical protein